MIRPSHPCLQLVVVSAFVMVLMVPCLGQREDEVVVTPYVDNPWYWQIDGQLAVLLGANETDHTFLMQGRAAYLDQLTALVGN